MTTYRCPHCDHELDHVISIEPIPLAPAAKVTRRYNRLQPDDLRQVLDLAETEGVDAVADEFGVSRRTADRYVAKARGL